MAAHHAVGQAKFLEQPLRTERDRIIAAIRRAYKSSRRWDLAVLVGALLLQAESQKLAPVLTGALRASAFTRLEDAGALPS